MNALFKHFFKLQNNVLSCILGQLYRNVNTVECRYNEVPRFGSIITITLIMASAQVVETSVNTNNSPSQDYTTNPDDHSNHNIDSPGSKPFTIILIVFINYMLISSSDQDY